MLLGVVLSWGVAVPFLTVIHPPPSGEGLSVYAMSIWVGEVRFIGVGIIGIAAIWSLAGLAGPTIQGVRDSLRKVEFEGWDRPRTDQDLEWHWVAAIFAGSVTVLAASFWAFMSGNPTFASFGTVGLLLISIVFAVVFGFLVAAACGYMAGLVGSSSSPISGIGILATLSASLLLLALFGGTTVLQQAVGRQDIIAMVLSVVSAVVATATISNDNLQDLKTGYLVKATPWRQQVALLVGVVTGALVIPPILDLLYTAHGFAGAMPRSGMDPTQALAAPQATLMTQVATGILGARSPGRSSSSASPQALR
jgi:putative OPT family oligopeptide transporter